MNDDKDYLLISQLTQAGYCLRRAALIMNEQIWKESADTAKGRIEHKRVHTQRVERRGKEVKLYEYTVFSDELGITGKCDCIEAIADEKGFTIPSVDFPVRLFPIEYKHGKVRAEEEYEVQLCAQAMCLEEMYHTSIPEGALFYTSSHRRYPVSFTEELREKVSHYIAQLRDIRDKMVTPAADYGAKCKRCSLREICMPEVGCSAEKYCRELAMAAKGAEES